MAKNEPNKPDDVNIEPDSGYALDGVPRLCFATVKYDLKKHPNYKYTAEADKRNAFDIGRLVTS